MGIDHRVKWLLIPLLILPGASFAHESWVMTAEQMQRWLDAGKPQIFTELGWLNVSLITAALLFCIGWIRLGATGARELFPDLQARLSSKGQWVAFIIRVCLAWTFFSAAFGLEPRVGIERFTHPTLLTADLDLHHLPGDGLWVRELQILLGIMFLFGIYTRLAAVLTIFLGAAGLIIFHIEILPYIGALWGCAAYLLLQGGGVRHIPLPVVSGFQSLVNFLEKQPRARAQFLLRVLTGMSILYAGVRFKVMEPQLIYGILVDYKVPILHHAPGFFALLMALVEVCAGVLMIAGVLLRPLSLFFLFAFVVFAALLPESFTAHSLFYGAMLSLLFNGAGQWTRPVARDQRRHIVIIGGGFVAAHAALRIQQLAGQFSNISISMVHYHGNLVFDQLLPEVISGRIQPGNVVSPLRRIASRTKIYAGKVARANLTERTLDLRLRGGELTLQYDALVLAMDPIPNFSGIPGIVSHAMAMGSVGDALAVRKRAFDLLSQADEFHQSGLAHDKWLTWTVIGSGQKAMATAVALSSILRSARGDFPILRKRQGRVLLLNDPADGEMDSRKDKWSPEILALTSRQLRAAGIECDTSRRVVSVGNDVVRFADGEVIESSLVVNVRTRLRHLPTEAGDLAWPLEYNDDLSLKHHPNTWLAVLASAAGRPRYYTPAELARLGRLLGENVWAASQGFPTREVKRVRGRVVPFPLGRHSLVLWKGLRISGIPAWAICRLACLSALPGLERNVRVMLDWLLDIPFRNDIAVLAPETSDNLATVMFDEGDVVIREGDEGSTAYLVQNGTLGVYRGDVEVAELSDGDCFGEIALLGNRVRTASVRCKTRCRLTVFTQQDFTTLTAGSSLFAEAIRKTVEERNVSVHRQSE